MPIGDIEETAALWFRELDAAPNIEDLWPRFERWLNEDPRHRAAFIRAEKVWKALNGWPEVDLLH